MRRLSLAATIAVTAVLAGCGGGDDGGDQLSAADYRAQATKICADAKRQTDALGRPKTTSEFKTFLAKGIRVTEQNLRRFEGLEPPDDLKAKHEAIVKGERDGLNQLKELSGQLKGDARDVALLRKTQPELARLSDETDARFRDAGLARCAQS
jgi:hypothetical protein